MEIISKPKHKVEGHTHQSQIPYGSNHNLFSAQPYLPTFP